MSDLSGDSPFPGLRPFGEADSSLFFGRAAAAHSLLANWLENRCVVVYGPSGSGKSSLLRAGVLPLLSSLDVDVLPMGRVRPDPHREGQAAARSDPKINPFAAALLSSWSGAGGPASLPPTLRTCLAGGRAQDAAGAGAGAGAGASAGSGPNRPVLAAVDQFEELLAPRTPALDPLREQLAALLANAAAALPDLRLLLVIRENHLEAFAPYEAALAAEVGVARVRIRPLDRRSAITALTEPVRRTGRSLSPDAAAAWVDDLITSPVMDAGGTRSVLVSDMVQPAYLQLAATALWRGAWVRTETGGPDPSLGGGQVDAVLRGYLTQVVVEEAHRRDLDDGAVRRWLARTFVTERGRRASVDEGIATTAGMPTALLAALAERYVLVCEWRAGSRRFELFDDRLIPPLQAAVPDWSVAEASAAAIGASDYLQAALISRADGDLEAARLHVGEVLRHEAAHPRTRAQAVLLRAGLDDAQGQLDQAERGYREAAELFASLPDAEASGSALAAAARLLLRTGRLGAALEALQAASAQMPSDPGVQIDLARALWYSGQRWAAAAIFSAALTLEPASATALAERGRLRVELGDNAAALADLDRAVRLASDAPEPAGAAEAAETRAAHALALARLGRPGPASAEMTAVLDDAPDNGPVLWCAAGVFRVIGDEPRADDLLRRALRAREPALLPHQRQDVVRMLRYSGAMA
jgi:tetratricopeptide (TPR) repeat protein